MKIYQRRRDKLNPQHQPSAKLDDAGVSAVAPSSRRDLRQSFAQRIQTNFAANYPDFVGAAPAESDSEFLESDLLMKYCAEVMNL